MKTLQFTVTLSFEGKVTSDEEIREVTRNIAESLEHTANTKGLAPEMSDTYTTRIDVSANVLPDEYTFIELN